MKNWEEQQDGICSSAQDFNDAKRVCQTLDIPYYTINLSKEYYEDVFTFFLEEYKKGRTPNPDVLCNRKIKFGYFKTIAMQLGVDYIATGHYCGIKRHNDLNYLIRAKDESKCQTYFLNQVTNNQLENVIFPLQDLMKTQVRDIAKQNNLITATKKDSTGICFIGERNFTSFLSTYIPMKQGEIRNLDEKIIGTHNGVFYYTLGQRKGLGIGGKADMANTQPWFVIKKDTVNNILYVNQGESPLLYTNQLITEGFNFITTPLKDGENRIQFRLRHRQPLQSGSAYLLPNGNIKVIFDTPQRAVTQGQYCVLYDDRICLGGGVINTAK